MNDKFFEISKEKQDRMINAALKIFAMYGYRHATTDDIVKEASISKGLLFHYFENKLGIYRFIYEYSVRYVLLEMNSCMKRQEQNMFEFLRQIEFAKLYIGRGYPYMMHFLNRSVYEKNPEALEAMEGKKQELLMFIEMLNSRMEGLDTIEDAAKWNRVIQVTIKGLLTEHVLEEDYKPEHLYEETISYINMMEKILSTN